MYGRTDAGGIKTLIKNAIQMKQEKTILEWLNQLPEPIKSQAIENTKNDNPFSGNEIVDSLWKAIDYGFLWSSTSQGGNYWFYIKVRAERGEFGLHSIPWPEEATWENAPEGTFARAIDEDGQCCFFFMAQSERRASSNVWYSMSQYCGKIADMAGIDWKQSLALS